MKEKINYLILLFTAIFIVGCTNVEDASNTDKETDSQELTTVETNSNNSEEKDEATTTVVDEPVVEENPTGQNNDLFLGYRLIEVDGGNLSGYREPNVVVDIGYGDRKYWAFTNEFGQLVRVIADEVVLQDDDNDNEPVTSSGRYYNDEAKVPGVERADLDEGHIIADSLGGDRILFEQNIKILLYII